MKGRRQFLARTSAAAVVGSIPAKSVWAANGMLNSIVASGHGSDFTYHRDIRLLRPCSIKNVLEDPSLGLGSYDLNFYETFNEGPNKKFSEILDCYCCPIDPVTLNKDISNVVFLVVNGTSQKQIKIDYTVTTRVSTHPIGYYAAVEAAAGGSGWTVQEYVIKAGNPYHSNPAKRGFFYHSTDGYITGDSTINSTGYNGWYKGYSGITELKNPSYEAGGFANNTCDETTVLMATIYLNAVLDYEFRGSSDPRAWQGEHNIFYPILRYPATYTDVNNLITSIKDTQTKSQLGAIFAEYGVDNFGDSCS
ncbi:hypothetical protein DS2_04670 [Catenovulum agarivorans DS-2]|uniref:Uncharacterized protein n=1 Tax=Catenovulum agarivorans DS-2 TaxID=1328313 RepID=W7QGW5_9ALTE|nr:hypothetical protein [Catenovulum agarivorans]EWH11121.1 hypothetical protein DS2_04670 [Catenovulum agarivorans DS-2]